MLIFLSIIITILIIYLFIKFDKFLIKINYDIIGLMIFILVCIIPVIIFALVYSLLKHVV